MNSKRDLKSWTRWTEKTKEFPKPKYRFTELLKHTGDYLETYDMDKADALRFNDAAKFWAYFHKKKVRIERIQRPEGKYAMRVTLVSHHRHREYKEY